MNSEIGLIHLIASCAALAFGSLTLIVKKGTRKHKRLGYGYVASMLVLLISSFMLYDLFGGFGVFHVGSIASSITLLAGVFPLIRKKTKNWLEFHFSMMYWSAIGLYAAFLSEISTRVLPIPFFAGVGIGTTLIMVTGAIAFKINSIKWKNQFKMYNLKR